MVINEIADAAGVSVPSVTRLAKKLGYSGFLDFRVSLASGSSSLESLTSDPIRDTDSNETVVEKAFGVPLSGDTVWLDGVMSRKKQVVPNFEKAFK